MIKNLLKKLIPNTLLNRYYLSKIPPKQVRKRLQFEVHLTEHCNLNCRGCNNFSPLAAEEVLDINIFERDFKRLSELFDKDAELISLLGGEPLLHPQVDQFLPIARKYFPNTKIKIVTNAILLLQQQDKFWESCRENNIEIETTKYPIKLQYDEIIKLAELKGVSFGFGDNTDVCIKTLHSWPIDIEGKQDEHKSFLQCSRANGCISLKDGKMFTCTVIPNICHFNRFFGENLVVSEEDYIDIFKAKNAKEILEFFIKPIPFCRYCDHLHFKDGIEWAVSKNDIKEWT